MNINPFSNIELNNSSTGVSQAVATQLSKMAQITNQTLMDLLANSDTISGKILSQDGEMVKISMGGNNLLTALLDTNSELPLGSNITFSVNMSDSGKVTLIPLMTNLNTNSPVSQALSSAGLVQDEKNTTIVESLMKEGMPINKENLLEMAKNLEDIPVRDIPQAVLLSKLGIQPTLDNMNQFNAYLGYEHQITSAVSDILDSLPQALNEMFADGQTNEALIFSTDIIDIFTNEGAQFPMDDKTLSLSSMDIPVNMILSETELSDLNRMLTDNGFPKEFSTEISQGNVSLDDVLHVIRSVIEEANPERPVAELLESRVFNKLIKTAVNNQWKLTPDQVGEDKQVSDLYKRITEQTSRILEVLEKTSKSDSPLAEGVKELGKNVSFINEVNNMFEYVQLPMKMSGNDAHGELYVYSNKKNLANSDGSVSALLHLDMDHLGPTDIYVTMNSSNHVNTHFYLPDEDSLDLIAAHIDELNARITDRGFLSTAEVSHRDEMTNIMKTIADENKSNLPISISAFDAKA